MEALTGCLGLLFFAGFIGLIVGLIVYQNKQRQRTAQEWTVLAQRHGLQFYPATGWSAGLVGEIQGVFQGRHIKVYTETRGSGKSRTTWTCIHTWMEAPLGVGLSVEPEGFLSAISKAFGGQDLNTGDQAFDGRFVVKADDAERALRLLNPEVRGLLLDASTRVGAVMVDDRVLRCELQNATVAASQVEAVLYAEAAVARELGLALSSVSVGVDVPAWEVAGR